MNNLSEINTLIKNNDDIHKQTDYILGYCKNESALLWAIEHGHLDIIMYLEKSIDIYNKLAFNTSVEYQQLKIINYLIQNGKYDQSDFKNGLYTSVTKGNLDMVKLFTPYAKNDKQVFYDVLKDSVENYSSNNKQLKIIRFLINNFDIDYVDKISINKFIFQYAAVNDYVEIIKILADHSYSHEYFLNFAVNGRRTQIVYFFIKKRVIIFDEALTHALEYNREDVVDYLLDCFSDLKKSLKNENLRNALIKYMMVHDLSKYQKIVNIFREIGIDLYDMIENEK